MKTLTCREHSGTFEIQPKRGRPPTTCGGAYQLCTNADSEPKIASIPEIVPEADKPTLERAREGIRARNARVNPSVAHAMEAKATLEAQGWLCKGRAFTTDASESYTFGTHTVSGMALPCVEVMATRGDETLLLIWLDGELVQQDYSLWHEKRSANNKPASNLGFDPDECTDREVVRLLSGCKITWWNKLGQFEQHAIVDGTKVRIEHLYNNLGDETPGDRIITFIDKRKGGFAAFRLGALIKVG